MLARISIAKNDISFSIPLAIRTARGRAASADARITGVGYELRLLIDEAKRDLRLSLVNLRATTELKEVALRELAVAQRLAEAVAGGAQPPSRASQLLRHQYESGGTLGRDT